MARKALEVSDIYGDNNIAKYIAQTWFNYHSQKQVQVELWKELRNYVFATDTTTTTNRSLPWKNSTTLPKLCQIRDNLHSNYISALFPNDDWLRWVGYSLEDETKDKANTIQAYMANKTREGGFREVASQLLLDYIDYGNAFATADFESSVVEDPYGEQIVRYIGPRARRISPLDIVFNPLADSFESSFKIVRSIKNIGELYIQAEEEPDNAFLQEALKRREFLKSQGAAYGIEDSDKAEGLQIDGFGNYFEYLCSDYVEILQFWGDIFDHKTKTLRKNYMVEIVDRCSILQERPIPSWMGSAPIWHAGWRKRPDNLWSMGPLENLIGMQYRIDHLENLKADAMDLAILPPIVIAGEVEDFDYSPGAEIHIDENGSVTELARNVQWPIQAENNINVLEQRMEMYAGAPREAMGIRTAGEKTAFEVQQLQNAAGRIFQEKITNFEITLLEKLLNGMLEISARHLDREDVIRVLDTALGVEVFDTITREDITASGRLRPIGARHFAAQAQMVQNLTAISQTPIWNQIAAHTSTVKLAALIEDTLGLRRFDLFAPNVAVFEQQETARMANQASEDLEVEQSTPTEL